MGLTNLFHDLAL